MADQATSTDSLVEAIKLTPTEVVVVAMLPSGSMQIISGPDVSLEHVNWLLDKAKSIIQNLPVTQTQPALSLVKDA